MNKETIQKRNGSAQPFLSVKAQFGKGTVREGPVQETNGSARNKSVKKQVSKARQFSKGTPR